MRIFLLAIALLLSFNLSAFAKPDNGACVRATGSAAIAHTFTPSDQAYLTSVRVHLSAAATADTFTVTVDSTKGTVYDTVLLSQDMTGYADLSWVPAGQLLLEKNEVVSIAWDNTDGITYGVEICYEY